MIFACYFTLNMSTWGLNTFTSVIDILLKQCEFMKSINFKSVVPLLPLTLGCLHYLSKYTCILLSSICFQALTIKHVEINASKVSGCYARRATTGISLPR